MAQFPACGAGLVSKPVSSRKDAAKRQTVSTHPNGFADMGQKLKTMLPAVSAQLEQLFQNTPKTDKTETLAASDPELLTGLITVIKPRQEKPDAVAEALLKQFGSVAGVISAPPETLLAATDNDALLAVYFQLVHEAAVRLHRARVKQAGVLADKEQLYRYLRAILSQESVEQVRVLFLDEAHTLLADEMQSRGTVDHTPIYPREVVRRALELKAHYLVLVHNHPSGDPSPSQDDVTMTHHIVQAADIMGITVWDHVIVGGQKLCSLKEEGLF